MIARNFDWQWPGSGKRVISGTTSAKFLCGVSPDVFTRSSASIIGHVSHLRHSIRHIGNIIAGHQTKAGVGKSPATTIVCPCSDASADWRATYCLNRPFYQDTVAKNQQSFRTKASMVNETLKTEVTGYTYGKRGVHQSTDSWREFTYECVPQ